MKKKFLSIAAIAAISFLGSCSKENINPIAEGVAVSSSMDDSVEQIPQAILDYLASNYPNIEVISAEAEDNDGEIAYEIHLADDTEVYFNADGGFLFAEAAGDGDDDDIAIADLPQAILDYVAANYPDATIEDANAEDNGTIEVELSNDLDLYFDAEGNFISIDTDDNNDDDNDDNDNDDDNDGDGDNDGDNDDDGGNDVAVADLPQAILDYVAANYPDATIDDADVEADGTIEVELSNDVELSFDTAGNFLSIIADDDNDDGDNDNEDNDDDDDDNDDNDDDDNDDDNNIAITDLPQIILDYIAVAYPDATIEEAEANADGTIEVELSNDLEVYFDAAGNFISVETDDDDNGDGG